MVAFWIDTGIQLSTQAIAAVVISSCTNSCTTLTKDIWWSANMKVAAGLDYEVYPPGISNPGSYSAGVLIWEPTVSPNNPVAAGYASFQVVGVAAWSVTTTAAATPFDFSLELSPPSTAVKQGETATFQILITYSDPSYSGTTINVQVSGLGAGMNYQLIPSPASLRVSTSPSTPPDNYHITITGSAKGVKHQAKALLTVKTAQSFDFSISITPEQQTITPGASTTSTLNVALLSGTPRSISLTVSGVPDGVSASLSPTSGKPEFKSTLSISITQSVAPGEYVLTITGTDGTTSHQVTFTLTIGESPDFRIKANPPSQTGMGGGTVAFQVRVVGLNGFSSKVALSLSGLPPGATGVFTTPTGTPNFTSTLTVTLPADAAAGSFTLTVTGSGGGVSRNANLVLNISPAAETSTQASTQAPTQTSSQTGSDLMSTLQQNAVLVLAVVILVVGVAVVAMMRRKPT